MVLKRCPQCGSASDDVYGFCIKCGYEFPKIEKNEHACPLCGFTNPKEAEFCVKCGTPLIFKQNANQNLKSMQPIVIKKEISKNAEQYQHKTSSWVIILGYIFSILGGIIGLIISIYLITRKDPVAKKHGYIQLAIYAFYIVLLAVLYATGNIPAESIMNYREFLMGNFTSLQR